MTAIKSQRGRSVALALALGPAVVGAELAIQSTRDIQATAVAFLQSEASKQHPGRVELTLGRIDPRLRLTACGQKLEAFQPPGARPSGRTSVGVRCPDAAGWTIYLTADVKLFGQALVITRTLARDARLNEGDVKLVETDLSALSQGHLRKVADVEGMVARRPITAGTVLTPSMVKAAQVVKRGDRVRIVGAEGPIQVEMMGEAMSSAARGERVRVRALSSKRVVEGWVISPSVVKVTL